MSVFREMTFKYGGEEIEIVPSLSLLRKIKSKGINNVMTANKCIKGGVDLEDLALILHEFLKAGGKSVPEDECYSFLTSGDYDEIYSFQTAYIQAVLPAVDFGKKPEAPSEKAES